MTTGSTLTDIQRQTIEHAFGCSVIDSYSCEGTPNTYQTEGADAYQICGYYGIIEVVDDDGKHVDNGTGRVVSTDLWNYAEPFIRYDTKDIVEVRDSKIVRIVGRSSECITLPDGSLLSANNLTHFFNKKCDTVAAYRLICHHDGSVEVLIVPTNIFSENDKREIADYWRKYLNTTTFVSIVDNIPMRKNGKHQTIVNETTD